MNYVWRNVTEKGKRFNMQRLGVGEISPQWTIPKIQMQAAEESQTNPLWGLMLY